MSSEKRTARTFLILEGVTEVSCGSCKCREELMDRSDRESEPKVWENWTVKHESMSDCAQLYGLSRPVFHKTLSGFFVAA